MVSKNAAAPRRPSPCPCVAFSMMHSLLTVVWLLWVVSSDAKNMNGKPGQYVIANGLSDAYSTDYTTEFFEVYTPPIKTRYSEVFWKTMDMVDLPKEVVERFQGGKVMAVTGYEVDQVRTDPVTGEDVPVPITWAYNHHYGAALWDYNKARMTVGKTLPPGATRSLTSHHDHYVMELLNPEQDDEFEEDIGVATLFSEANGGEFRMSYHGYPKGYAQLIRSPNKFQTTPMQIDTWNRATMDGPKYHPGGPLPSSSRIPPEAGYSGLLECPCSDRRSFEWDMTYAFFDPNDEETSDTCTGPIEEADECFLGARRAIESESYAERHVDDASLPSGCSVELHEDGSVDIVWNEGTTIAEDKLLADEAVETTPGWVSFRQAQINITVALLPASDSVQGQDVATITLVGPADKWFGAGFGTNSMCIKMEADECPAGGPYAIIVSGDTVVERRLGFHGPGTVIAPSVTIVSNDIYEKNRTVVLSRPWAGATSDHYTFDPETSATVPIITARGCGLEFSQHCGHGPSELEFIAVNTPTGICQAGIEGTISGSAFVDGGRCYPFPGGDLLDQGNPTCSVTTYQGGLSCCVHGESLLDADQEVPWPDQFLEYRLKFRFYFEEYTSATALQPASHHNMVRMYWQTEAYAGEYDIPPCRENEPKCIHVITARWKVHQMLQDCPISKDGLWCSGVGVTDDNKTEGIELIYAAPHCHAPTCISMELYNMDTGRLLCSVEPIHGETDELYDESQFLAIPPCLWSHDQDGLAPPELLTLNTTLYAIKRNNNTYPHTGEMASWQMRGIVVPKQSSGEELVVPRTKSFLDPALSETTSDATSIHREEQMQNLRRGGN